MDAFVALGLPPHASAEDAGRVYRRLAQECHPDRNPTDPDAARTFAALTRAYEDALAEIRDGAPPDADPDGRKLSFAGRDYRRLDDGGLVWWSEARGSWLRISDGSLPLAGHTAGRGVAKLRRWWRGEA